MKLLSLCATNILGFCFYPDWYCHVICVCRLPESQQRIGGFFLGLIPQMKKIYLTYCSNHPSAVNVLTQHRYRLIILIHRKNFLSRKSKLMCCILYILSVCVYHSEELKEYMESKGAPPPGILALTTSLSKPFIRLDRYPTLLKELDRHMEVSLNCSSFCISASILKSCKI